MVEEEVEEIEGCIWVRGDLRGCVGGWFSSFSASGWFSVCNSLSVGSSSSEIRNACEGSEGIRANKAA